MPVPADSKNDVPIEESIPEGGVPLESILCTEELQRRPSRPPDYEKENRALVKLVSALADSPGTILQMLAETILDITQCDSAGLSLLTRDGKTPDICGKRFYWPAIAGMWNPHVGGGTPRSFGPCGDVLDQNRTLLFRHFERRYPYLLPVIPAAEECLLVPFYVAGEAVGTIWAIMHSDRRRFDAEDDRVMASLGKFASSAYQALKHIEEELKIQVAEREKAEAEVRAEVGIALARKDSLRGILDVCAKAMVRHLDATFARIWTLKRDDQELKLQASAGLYTRLDGSYSRIPFGEFKIGCIAQQRKPHLTNDVQSDPQVVDHDWARAENINSFAGYPLIVEDRIVGVMGMFSRKPLSEETLDTLTFISDGIAQCIERKEAEEQLRRSETDLTEAQSLSHTGSWHWHPRTGDVTWSQEFFAIFGFDPEKDRASYQLYLERVHPEDRSGIEEARWAAVREERDFEAEYRLLLPGGMIKYVHSIGRFSQSQSGEIEYIGAIMDTTDRKRAEEEREKLRGVQAELAHMNRVSTMGELTASLAHEIKQPISAAMTNAQTCLRLLGRDQPDVPEAQEATSRLIKDVTRASKIISRIHPLFQKGAPQRELVDINELIREMNMLLRGEAATNSISIHSDLASGIPQIMADRVQLQQVLMNLMLNGIEAMKDMQSPGRLTITSRQGEDDQLLVSVTDTGVGLRPGQAEEIFNVFFTSKPQGTGMGLPISRSIIESHGGRLWTIPISGKGAVFHFTLPIEVSAH